MVCKNKVIKQDYYISQYCELKLEIKYGFIDDNYRHEYHSWSTINQKDNLLFRNNLPGEMYFKFFEVRMLWIVWKTTKLNKMNFDACLIAKKKFMCKSIEEQTLALFNYLRMNNGTRMTRICNSFAYFTLLSYYLR